MPRNKTGRLPNSGAGSRARKKGGPITLPDAPLKQPAAPRHLSSKRARAAWRDLWSSPVAALWRVDLDAPIVERLILLRERIDRDGLDAPRWVFAAAQAAEDRLFLNWRSRRTAGIAVVPPEDEPAPAKRNGASTMTARRRARVEATIAAGR